MVYNERGQTHHYWNPAKREYSNLVQFMIYDDAVAQDPMPGRLPLPDPRGRPRCRLRDQGRDLGRADQEHQRPARSASAARAKSLPASAPMSSSADDFVDKLAATIERFNGFATSGVDEDFGRGSTPIQIAWGAGTERAPQEQEPNHGSLLGDRPLLLHLARWHDARYQGRPGHRHQRPRHARPAAIRFRVSTAPGTASLHRPARPTGPAAAPSARR